MKELVVGFCCFVGDLKVFEGVVMVVLWNVGVVEEFVIDLFECVVVVLSDVGIVVCGYDLVVVFVVCIVFDDVRY